MKKIDLITGILGSGKTTFLLKYADYLLRQGLRIAVLENDYGAVNTDMAYLRELPADRCVITSIVGGGDPDCHRRRFKTQLISLGMQQVDRVIVEPSGIFDMDEFFDTLYESPIDKWFEIGSILTVADAQSEALLPTQMEYLLGSEAACCGKVVVSKLGKVEESAESVTQRILAHINRALLGIQCDRQLHEAEIFAKDWDALNDADFAMLANAGYRGANYVKLFSADMIHSEVHYFMRLAIDPVLIEQTVRAIFADPACGRLYRIKGSLPNGKGSWLRLNAVNGEVQLTPAALGQPVLIAIGDDLDKAAIDRHFLAVNTAPDYLSL